MSRIRLLSVACPALMLALAACSETAEAPTSVPEADASVAVHPSAHAHRQYGRPVRLGNGIARTYIVSERDGREPQEIGIALSARALEGLPAPMPMDGGMDMGDHGGIMSHSGSTVVLLDLPAQNRTPYRFVELDWNPAGHEPPGIYDLPHFDFHFYTVAKAVRASIVPTDPDYATRAANFPAPEYRPPFYLDAATAAGVAPAMATVPEMGLHWLDLTSPELQGLAGHPENYKPFTKTFIYGSWDGRFIFDEPMITRDYILAKRATDDPAVRDEIVPVFTADRYAPAGYYPSAYRITWDEQAKEYRIALTELTWRN